MTRLGVFLLVFVIPLFLLSTPLIAANPYEIYINGQNLTAELDPRLTNGEILVKARSLADCLEAELNWLQAIKTLHITKGDTVIKLMDGSPYIQVNNKTFKANQGLVMIGGRSYIPIKDVATNLGFLYEREADTLYLNRPESLVKGITWQKGGKQIVIEMDKLSPYRVNPSENPKELLIELDKAALADDFQDGISNNDFYLKVKKVANKARIQFSINSKYPIPFQRDIGLEEDGNNLVVNFLPQVTAITWEDDGLEIRANGEMEKPEVMLLQNPRRLVLDVPGLMLSDYNLNLPENDMIKDIRVSQFTYDPVVLRVVVELKEGSYLHLFETEDRNKLILRPTRITRVDNLKYENNQITFTSDYPVKPDIFTLNAPDRLVINLLNAVRGNDFPDNLTVESDLISGIRTSRFNEETVRIVVDLVKHTGFHWQEIALTQGGFQHIILLENSFENMVISDNDNTTHVNINLSGKAEYEIKKFSYPDRIVVDIQGINIEKGIKLPEPVGVIKNIEAFQLNDDPGVGRFVFELEDYYSYNLLSLNPDKTINISISREKKVQSRNLIVIDPGHGGFDPGAIGPSGLMEKDVNLDIALKVFELLKARGYEVKLTRKDDTFISLKERVEIANDLEALLYISIHANASNSKYSEGTETFIAPDKVTNSLLLANLLQEELLNGIKRFDRGVKKDNLYVIKYTRMPAVLVEVAFISNPHEEALLEGDLFRRKAAEAITNGIIKYLDKIK